MFLGTTTELFRFCGLRPAFFRLLKRAFVPKFAIPFVHARNSRVGASNHKHSLLDKHPFKKEKHVGWFPFLQRACSCRGPFSKEFRRGELDGREPFPFPLGSRFFSGSCFIPHLTIRVYLLLSIVRFLYCFLFLCPQTCPSLQQRQRWAFSSCLSREEKCFSRISCSRFRTTFFW